MDMKNKNSKKFNKVNQFILNLNRSSFMFIIIAYMLLLTLLVVIITPSKNFIVVPSYQHVIYHDEITPQITLVGIRTFDDNDKMTLRYSVQAKMQGRLDENKVDPKLEISRFQMSSYLANKKMYYFTEQTNRTTPISHTYTMSTTEYEENIPDQFFIKLNYKNKNGESKIATFLEDVYLEMPQDVTYTSNNIVPSSNPNSTLPEVEIDFYATKNAEAYLTSVSIMVNDISKKYHVDMQSWIVTEDGEALPFIGVYGYSDEKYSYTLSNREVNLKLKPKELYSYLKYYVEDSNKHVTVKTIAYKVAFTDLGNNPGTNPTTPPETTPSNTKWIPWTVAVCVLIGTGVGVTFALKKKKSKEVTEDKK